MLSQPGFAQSSGSEQDQGQTQTRYESRLASLKRLHNGTDLPALPQVVEFANADAQGAARRASQAGADPGVANLIGLIKQRQLETVTLDEAEAPTPLSPMSRLSFTTSNTVITAASARQVTQHNVDSDGICHKTVTGQVDSHPMIADDESLESTTQTQEDTTRSTSPSSIRSAETVIHIGQPLNPMPRTDTSALERDMSAGESDTSGKIEVAIEPVDAANLSPSIDSMDPMPTGTPPNTPLINSSASDTSSDSQADDSSSESSQAGQSSSRKRDSSSDNGEDDSAEDGDEDASEGTESEDVPEDVGVLETMRNLFEDPYYHNDMVLKRWARRNLTDGAE
ncbi:hypothetical protein SLS60_010985 [Paraconiothyrium brasiliense]|uniref:Uncharacterized protein n=1 Tax=Paraconiothyrium brasiliense TaxID=300254 RepID=A0ABR3QMK5_9PLEO